MKNLQTKAILGGLAGLVMLGATSFFNERREINPLLFHDFNRDGIKDALVMKELQIYEFDNALYDLEVKLRGFIGNYKPKTLVSHSFGYIDGKSISFEGIKYYSQNKAVNLGVIKGKVSGSKPTLKISKDEGEDFLDVNYGEDDQYSIKIK